MAAHLPDLVIRAGLLPGGAAATLFCPGLGGLPPARAELLAALPVVDLNAALLAALPRRPWQAPPAGATLFAADPFLRVADLLPRLRQAGIRRVANWPTVQVHDGGELARGLHSAGIGLEAELRMLADLAAGGIEPLGYAASAEAGQRMLAAGIRSLVLHPGPAVADWRQRAAAGAAMLAAAQALAAEGAVLRLHRPAGYGAELDAAAAAVAGCVSLG
ncbi:phosphoenolpyruvate hydrolase family protein [Paracraurococcus ruber]|uniref:TIM-barrel domain-containing protein n=1 Tax=Paracraurococcus ruber TaxID=77675 RepID=A0ABS1CS36_9PROT|nr:phosphoenolpyruvate hydrolase family protein [Paracraurococcus ruber]MBK1657269.1 hypothetical protein [Paracraurococcus ruber]TDG33157.1 hypothetical protein E2C05_04700 [Paracraurococcus ruber]